MDNEVATNKKGRGRSKSRPTTSQQQVAVNATAKRGRPMTRSYTASNAASGDFGANIPTQNIFAPLGGENENNMDNSTTQTQTPNPKVSTKKLSPIILKNAPLNDAKEMMSHLHITDYNFQLISIGLKIFVKSIENLQKLRDFLDEQQIPYFSYQDTDSVLAKYVIYGLNTYPLDELKAELAQHNIVPKNITTLKIKKQRFADECIYLVYFNKGVTNLNELRKIKSLFHTIVQWDHFVNKHKGPSQCRNCLMFGHSSYNCHILPKCVRCGEQHESINCVYLADGASKIPVSKVKCANCDGAHTANYHLCPARQEYLSIKDRIQLRQPKGVHRTSQHFRSNTLDPRTRANQTGDFTHHTNHTNNFSFNKNKNLNNTYANVVSGNVNNQNNSSFDLFKPDECIKIMTELITSMRNCRSKSDQLMVIANLTMKYIEHGP